MLPLLLPKVIKNLFSLALLAVHDRIHTLNTEEYKSLILSDELYLLIWLNKPIQYKKNSLTSLLYVERGYYTVARTYEVSTSSGENIQRVSTANK